MIARIWPGSARATSTRGVALWGFAAAASSASVITIPRSTFAGGQIVSPRPLRGR